MMTQQGVAFLDEEDEIQGRTLDGGAGINAIRRRAVFVRGW
jgi:hypothetical protein